MRVKVIAGGGIGVKIRDKWILVDPVGTPSFKPDIILVSHAHSDHYNLEVINKFPKTPVILSKATYDLISREGRILSEKIYKITEGSTIEVNGVEVRAYSAGHIIGSLQFLIQGEVAYTGDICLERRNILKPARILKAGKLIIEATYGAPTYIFPKRPTLYRTIYKLVQEATLWDTTLRLACRSPGVAQEVIELLNRRGVPVACSREIAMDNEVYERYGYLKRNAKSDNPQVLIMPLMGKKPPQGSVMVSGWAMDEGGIPMSSHSGFDRLIEYVNRSGAEEVYTAYGYAKEFASVLKDMGFKARHLAVK